MMRKIEKKNLTGLECNAILYVLEHGQEGWGYAYSTYCEYCQARETCNILKGKVEILGDEKRK